MLAAMKNGLRDIVKHQNKVQNKIFLPFVFVMLLIGALIIYVMTNLVSANVEARVNEKLRNDVRLIQEIITDLEEDLAFYAQFIADTEKLAGHISEARDSRLVLIYLLEFLRENHIYSNIGGSSPLASGDSDLSRLGHLGIRTTGLVADKEDGRTRLALSAVAPIEGHTGSRSVITVSREFNQEFLSDLRKKTGAHRIQIYYGQELVDSSSPNDGCDELVDKAVPPARMIEILEADEPYVVEFRCDEHSARTMFAAVRVNYRKEAVVAVFESMDDLVAARTSIILTTVVVVGLMLLIIVPIYILTVLRTIGPIRKLSQASKRIAEGKLDQYVPVKSRDEVGELSESFNKMVGDLKKYRDDIERWNQTLEERVASRTRELAETQAKLIQSTKLAAVGELAAGIAHELNNPLAGIYAFLQVFAKTLRSHDLRDLSEDDVKHFRENLVHVEHEIQRCKSIIGSLLTFARVSEKRYDLVDLNRTVRDTLSFMQANLSKSNIMMEVHLDENLPKVKGDADELRQVFLNIIVNARKAMPDGGDIFVVTESRRSDHSVCVAISDTGGGIEPEVVSRIFDPFFTTSEPGEGTGLGLSISYGIIKDHDGEILVESRQGEGSTFSIILPAAGHESEDDNSVPREISPGKTEKGSYV